MKKKKIMIIGVIVVLIIAIVGIIAVSQSSKMSERSFDAVVQEIVTQPDGEVRLIVERTTEIYGDPVNSLGISEDTKLLDADGNETDTPAEGCRLVSVGENEDNKLIILSNNKNLLRKELIDKST